LNFASFIDVTPVNFFSLILTFHTF
jgi:hypothetical protein